MIRNLIYDFGGVLVDYDFEAFFRKFVHDERRLRELVSTLNNRETVQILDREARPFDENIAKIIQEHRALEKEIKTFCEHYQEIVTNEVKGMRALLTKLKAEGFKLYGLTNWCSKVYLTINQFGIFNLLDGYVISSEEHIIKPEPEIYQRLFSRFGLKPEECIFTDDRPENIEGGRQLGMDGIVFHDAVQYERELRAKIS